MRNLDPTTIALIVLGVTALICALGILILKKRGSKGSSSSTIVDDVRKEEIRREEKRKDLSDGMDSRMGSDLVIRMKPEAPPPPDAYRSIYSFIPGSDRIVCPNCGAEYDRSAVICTVCGQKL